MGARQRDESPTSSVESGLASLDDNARRDRVIGDNGPWPYASLLDPLRTTVEEEALATQPSWQSRIATSGLSLTDELSLSKPVRQSPIERDSMNTSKNDDADEDFPLPSPVENVIKIHDLDHVSFKDALLKDIVALKTTAMHVIGTHVTTEEYRSLLTVQTLAYKYYAKMVRLV